MSLATSAFFLALFGMKCRSTAVLPGSCIATTYPKSETSKHTYTFLLLRKCSPGRDKKVKNYEHQTDIKSQFRILQSPASTA